MGSSRGPGVKKVVNIPSGLWRALLATAGWMYEAAAHERETNAFKTLHEGRLEQFGMMCAHIKQITMAMLATGEMIVGIVCIEPSKTHAIIEIIQISGTHCKAKLVGA